jgi:hypothetical protein
MMLMGMELNTDWSVIPFLKSKTGSEEIFHWLGLGSPMEMEIGGVEIVQGPSFWVMQILGK